MPIKEIFGVAALSTMLLAYALERRSNIWVLVFALGCFASSLYGWLIDSIPFCAVEIIWGMVALRRWWRVRKEHQ